MNLVLQTNINLFIFRPIDKLLTNSEVSHVVSCIVTYIDTLSQP